MQILLVFFMKKKNTDVLFACHSTPCTMQPRLMATLLQWPPHYYSQHFFPWQNKHTFPYKETLLMRPPHYHIIWACNGKILKMPTCVINPIKFNSFIWPVSFIYLCHLVIKLLNMFCLFVREL